MWDVAVRLFHWGLVAAVLTAWLTGGSGNHIHEISGSVVAALLIFRLIWGVVGTRHARFSEFVYRPRAFVAYLRDLLLNRAECHVGHNPAGGAMIVALLICLATIVVTGFMQLTNRFYGLEWVERIHHIAANVLMCLVPLHLLGVVVSSWMHQENLVGAMITGSKPSTTSKHPAPFEPATDREGFAFRLLAGQGFSTLLFLVAGGLAIGWVLTSGRIGGVVVETQTPLPIPAVIVPAIQKQAVARERERQDYATSAPDDASLAWVLSSGGRLYDNMFASLETKASAANHPAWPHSHQVVRFSGRISALPTSPHSIWRGATGCDGHRNQAGIGGLAADSLQTPRFASAVLSSTSRWASTGRASRSRPPSNSIHSAEVPFAASTNEKSRSRRSARRRAGTDAGQRR